MATALDKFINVGYKVIETKPLIDVISECNRIAQKEYKTTHDWVGKVINWELCKKLKFHHYTKFHMYKPKSILEREVYKILWDFKAKTNHLTPN